MKKLVLIGVTVGIASLAQAVNFVSGGTIVSSPTVLSGGNAYIYQEQVTALTLSANQSLTATIYFNNIDLTANSNPGIHNVFYYDVVNQELGGGTTQVKTISPVTEANYSAGQDYFTQTYGNSAQIGSSLQIYPGPGYFPLNTSSSWNTSVTGTALNYLTSELEHGYFDIGFDPNCPYNIGSITLSWQITTTGGGGSNAAPDHAMTVSLLGMSFLGLTVFRRKLALN